ncbi:phage envelope protein [Elizabethkingia miricola]|uniref:Phage envelope protein n=1 Tax=Elizabethkingia miricola TaxID=172045 RepID=A0ABD4DMA3_ELIMR|nr:MULTISPECIES: DUF1398 family protein [Elizabethkingia]KUG12876.1 phage envelope protein [Elizabethkingia miricola]KUY19966.1 phage envelope protein [Elizabethkingia miricola]MCL1651625.1 DUF1398 domain-containing protein [Elizabethkingia miricola]MCL1655600.1 DUF1398 domain-containing protein [Elizabethkingia miricola]MCL1678736.1 DUF1398 domain-containing protein [Elizabethkingia miricola]
MFTIEQIKAAHSKVKSGADFPAYIQDLKKLGVISYETFVTDGHADYYGANSYKTCSTSRYEALIIADIVDEEQFKRDLKSHQQGNTDYLRFCNDTAKSGIEKWLMDLDEMTCTYYCKNGKKILTEKIPG